VESGLNPACSKCRTALSAFDEAGVAHTVRRYLDVPPSALGLGIADWPRDAASRTRWIGALAAHPSLIQRPIITADDGTTVVGRDPDSVQQVISRARP
jgi:arsenate reductase